MQDHIDGGRIASTTELSLRDDIVRVARSTSQGGMTLDQDEVRTLWDLLRPNPASTSPLASDVHRVAVSTDQSGMTLEDDEVRTLALLLADA
jgi:hypothetical protein